MLVATCKHCNVLSSIFAPKLDTFKGILQINDIGDDNLELARALAGW